MTVADPAELRTLAHQAKRLGIQIFRERLTGAYYASCHRDPERLLRLSAYTCTCAPFLRSGRCLHLAALFAHLGWLEPDPDPDPGVVPLARGSGRKPADFESETAA